MNSSGSSSIYNGALNWFQLQEISWGLVHYITNSYVLLMICVLAIIENLAIVVVISIIPSGVAKTARLYYLTLSYCEIGNMFYYLLNVWSETGLKYLTQGNTFLPVVETNPVACKALRGFTVFFPHVINWTYLLLNVERLVAIAYPLRARSRFNVHQNVFYIAILVVVGLLIYAFNAYVMTISYTPMLLGGPNTCFADTSSVWKAVVHQAVNNIDVYIVPPALSACLAVALVVLIRRQLVARDKLLDHTGSKSDTGSASVTVSGGASQSAIAGGVVAVTMSVVHAAIHLPAGLFGLLYFMCAFYCFALHESEHLSPKQPYVMPTDGQQSALTRN